MKHVISFFLAVIAPVALIFVACTSETVVPLPPRPENTSVYFPRHKAVPVPPPERRQISSEKLPWFSVTDAQIKNAVCQTSVLTTTAEIEKYFSNLPKPDENSFYEYKKVQFKNERPSLIQAFADLTDNLEWHSKKPLLTDLQAKYQINPDCTQVLCAVKKMFGADVGPKMLYLMHKYDLNTSPLSWDNADLMTDDEITDVLQTMRFFPPQLMPINHLQKLIRFSHGYMLGNGDGDETTIANSSIELFDPWSEQSHLDRQLTLFHEIGHNMSQNFFDSFDGTEAWRGLGNWKDGTLKTDDASEKISRAENHSAVSIYGSSNRDEDFAESFNAYRFNPKYLKSKSLGKYRFMKEIVFDGLEFNSEKDCDKPLQKQKIQDKIDHQEMTWNDSELQQIASHCGYEFYYGVLDHLPAIYFQQCVDYQATILWQKKNPTSFGKLIPRDMLSVEFHRSDLHFEKLYRPVAELLHPKLASQVLDVFKGNIIFVNNSDDDKQACQNATKYMTLTATPPIDDFSSRTKMYDAPQSPSPTTFFQTCLGLANNQSLKNNLASPLDVEKINRFLQPRYEALFTPARR